MHDCILCIIISRAHIISELGLGGLASAKPEWSVIKSHIADINNRIPIPDISSYADDLLQAGLICQAGHNNALAAMGTGPHVTITLLTSEAKGKIWSMPHLFSTLVDIIEKRSRDESFASMLRKKIHK